MKTINVVAAVIRKGDSIFATQRGYGDYKDWWEFPGGKVETGETAEEALIREIKEELDTDISVDSFITTIEYDYPVFHLHMDCFWCSIAKGDLTLLEHEASRWLKFDELDQVKWLPADMILIESIKEKQNRNKQRLSSFYLKIDDSFGDKIRETCASLVSAIQKAIPQAQLVDDFIKGIKLPKIEIPKISIPPELLEAFKRFKYLDLYRRADWPLYFIDNEEIRSVMDPFFKDDNLDPIAFRDAVLSYYDTYGVETITDHWNDSECIETERLPVLHEAIEMYNKGYYYGCVSVLMCQISGIICKAFSDFSTEDDNFDLETIKGFYKSYNSGHEMNKDIEEALLNSNKRGYEKQKVLGMLADVDFGAFYWISALDYLYKTVFTSEDNRYNHVCRNKICHGVQLNYGDKEHAIKAILSVDMVVRIAERNMD